MASELRVNTLKDAAGANSVAVSTVFNGSAKAWAKCSADGTSITDSFNITSLADDGTGLQTLTIASDMANTNYAGLATSINSFCTCIVDSHATGTYRAVTRNQSGTLTDAITQSALMGDLA